MTLKRGQGFGPDVVFDALGVHFGGRCGDADGEEEAEDSGVSLLGRRSHRHAGFRQLDGAVGGGEDEAVSLETIDGATDRDVADAKALREVADAGLAASLEELGDGLNVVFGHLRAIGTAHGSVSVADPMGPGVAASLEVGGSRVLGPGVTLFALLWSGHWGGSAKESAGSPQRVATPPPRALMVCPSSLASRFILSPESMNYRRMGRTGLQISSVSIGGWLTFGGSVGASDTRSIIKAAVDAGINFIDLADVYSKGAAESVIGDALADYQRSDLVLSSKVFGRMGDGPNDRGLSRKHIIESVEASLKRLKTDYLDLYFCHRSDAATPLEETVRAMDDLVHQGKVHYWGTSVWPADALQSAHDLCDRRGYYPPLVEQPQYSLLERSIEADVMPEAARLGMGLVVWSPLAGGLLTGKYGDGVPDGSRGAETSWLDEKLNDETRAKVRELVSMAEGLGVQPAQLALAWILSKPEITSVITGATRVEHVTANVAAAELELSSETVSKLDEVFQA
ncbi:MAG: voltage-dependent potassium channel beta subunit [Planctomycetota bacterium]|jgi:voltage-dependent potassium channel beta subunit